MRWGRSAQDGYTDREHTIRRDKLRWHCHVNPGDGASHWLGGDRTYKKAKRFAEVHLAECRKLDQIQVDLDVGLIDFEEALGRVAECWAG